MIFSLAFLETISVKVFIANEYTKISSLLKILCVTMQSNNIKGMQPLKTPDICPLSYFGSTYASEQSDHNTQCFAGALLVS